MGYSPAVKLARHDHTRKCHADPLPLRAAVQTRQQLPAWLASINFGSPLQRAAAQAIEIEVIADAQQRHQSLRVDLGR
jgi:hypothetical protein